MVHIIPPHAPLESNEDRRRAVRRRGASLVGALVVILLVSVLVGVFVCPLLTSVVTVAFGVGLIVGRRL